MTTPTLRASRQLRHAGDTVWRIEMHCGFLALPEEIAARKTRTESEFYRSNGGWPYARAYGRTREECTARLQKMIGDDPIPFRSQPLLAA